MTDIILPYSGVTVATQKQSQPHEWARDTHIQSYLAFYKYCADNNLFTEADSDKEMGHGTIKKRTYLHLGASGDSASQVEINWLQSRTGSSSTDVYTLWLTYFNQHRTVPDGRGLTYDNMSVEAGYLKWLREYLGFTHVFNDFPNVTDRLKMFLRKNFTSDVSVADHLAHVLIPTTGYLSTATLDSFVVLSQKKSVIDNINLTDSAYIKTGKRASDVVNIIDAFDLANLNIEGYLDLVNLEEKVELSVSKPFQGAANIGDSSALKQVKVFNDGIALSDNVTLLSGLLEFPADRLFIEETVLILLKKSYSDVISLTDEAQVGYVSFGAGSFGEYYMGV